MKLIKVIKLKRLKIVEQILLIVLLAVIIPMITSGVIISNINQHAIRAQLNNSAILISKVVSEELDVVWTTMQNELEQIKISEEFVKNEQDKSNFLKTSLIRVPSFSKIDVINYNPEEIIKREQHSIQPHDSKIFTQMSDGRYLVATINPEYIKKHIFKSMNNDERQIILMNSTGQIIAAHNYTDKDFQFALKNLPKRLAVNKPVEFGSIKNQPLVYIKKDNPEITIIVSTTEKITKNTINKDRSKIVMSILFASLFIIILVGFYTYYLYINIRQLFKGIIALSKGNYKRKIKLLKSAFTPYEVVFLAFEFNRMSAQIHRAYKELQTKNKELKRLDKFRSNLIDTVSHEFRTPLTSIQGYTSRLLRQDIVISDEMKQKSLRTIKRQSEKLSRMVEDLLIVPDIDGARLNVNIEQVLLTNIIETSSSYVTSNDFEVINNVPESFPFVMGDKDRLEQVFVNLFENAKKYAYPDTPVVVDVTETDKYAHIYVKNKCDKLDNAIINKLFEKFIRIDNETTRTTRGTGLGLFIVKGLVEAMGGKIKLHSTDEFGFIAELRLKLYDE